MIMAVLGEVRGERAQRHSFTPPLSHTSNLYTQPVCPLNSIQFNLFNFRVIFPWLSIGSAAFKSIVIEEASQLAGSVTVQGYSRTLIWSYYNNNGIMKYFNVAF